MLDASLSGAYSNKNDASGRVFTLRAKNKSERNEWILALQINRVRQRVLPPVKSRFHLKQEFIPLQNDSNNSNNNNNNNKNKKKHKKRRSLFGLSSTNNIEPQLQIDCDRIQKEARTGDIILFVLYFFLFFCLVSVCVCVCVLYVPCCFNCKTTLKKLSKK